MNFKLIQHHKLICYENILKDAVVKSYFVYFATLIVTLDHQFIGISWINLTASCLALYYELKNLISQNKKAK